ncbi:hypothetical protein [Haloferax volcanii]|uniref:hypothetical protein n=1 Tax=Haloferax volcanii TaxID=2246 RepID=UPI0038540F4D
MTPALYRPLAAVGFPAIGVLVLLQIFSPSAVAGVPVSTVVGVTMTTFLMWGTAVGLTYKARWTATGFGVMATVFAIQTITQQGIQNDLVVYLIVGIAALLIVVGGQKDEPTPPISPRSSQ